MDHREKIMRLSGIILAILLMISVLALVLVFRHRKAEATKDHVQITENVIDSQQVAERPYEQTAEEGWRIV